MTHKYTVGQAVDLTPSVLQTTAPGEYAICRLMPPADGDPEDPCYRIKSIGETHERAVRESEIALSLRPKIEQLLTEVQLDNECVAAGSP